MLCLQFDKEKVVSGSKDKTIKVTTYIDWQTHTMYMLQFRTLLALFLLLSHVLYFDHAINMRPAVRKP